MPGLELSKLLPNLFLIIANIVLLYLVVRMLIYKPVKNFMDARNARTIAETEKINVAVADVEKLKTEYSGLLEKGDKEVEDILAEGRDRAAAEAAAILSKAQKDAENIIAVANWKAEVAHREALDGMQDEMIKIAFDITKKLLERDVDDSDNMEIAKRFFASHKEW